MKNNKEKILQQTAPGRLKARELCKLGGRPKQMTIDKIQEADNLYTCTNMPITEICKKLEISRPTFYAYLKEYGFK